VETNSFFFFYVQVFMLPNRFVFFSFSYTLIWPLNVEEAVREGGLLGEGAWKEVYLPGMTHGPGSGWQVDGTGESPRPSSFPRKPEGGSRYPANLLQQALKGEEKWTG
jgi:hypothetical protein